ncbi:MAG: SPFH domain-containing protein [Bdellovibrionales bacterium]|nr:SPFH domain-containing protein [Bdellovibrionales bacterium]
MGSFLRALLLLIPGTLLGAYLLMLFVPGFGKVVPPGYFGIRQRTLGIEIGQQGYLPDALAPGLHYEIPLLDRVHLIPSTLQNIHFNRERQESSSSQEKHPSDVFWRNSLSIENLDKGEVLLDVTVLARFLPTPKRENGALISGGPKELFEQVGLTPKEWVDRIEFDVKDQLRVELRQLTNAEFYNPQLREHTRVRAAEDAVNEKLRPLGIEIEGILVRRYTYQVEEVNRAIAEKNLQVQRERVSDVESSFAKVRAELDELSAKLKAEIDVVAQTAPQEVRAIRSEGDLAFSRDKAEGDRLVIEAQAEAAKLKADVFAANENADTYLAQELAPLLGTLRGGVVSDIDPYDLQAWMKKLGLDREGIR